MGATVLGGLTGNLDLLRLTQSGNAHWFGEHADITRSNAGFNKVSMAPKTVSGEYEVSGCMLLQSQTPLELLLRSHLGWLPSQALALAAIKGGLDRLQYRGRSDTRAAETGGADADCLFL